MSAFDITVTRTLLQADKSTLSKDEADAVQMYLDRKERVRTEADSMNKILREECPLTCSGHGKTMIPSSGWCRAITPYIYEIEMLNREAIKHGMIAAFDQVKEKFGTYRGYYSILHPKMMVGNCDITDHVFKEDHAYMTWFDEKIESIVREIENKCFDVCEHCGYQFSSDTPRCCTTGWTSYVCQTCANAMGSVYTIDGVRSKDGKEHIYFKEGKEVENPYNHHVEASASG